MLMMMMIEMMMIL